MLPNKGTYWYDSGFTTFLACKQLTFWSKSKHAKSVKLLTLLEQSIVILFVCYSSSNSLPFKVLLRVLQLFFLKIIQMKTWSRTYIKSIKDHVGKSDFCIWFLSNMSHIKISGVFNAKKTNAIVRVELVRFPSLPICSLLSFSLPSKTI